LTKEELALAARRFVCVIEGLEFTGKTFEHKDVGGDKTVTKPTHEVRRGPSFIMNTDSEDEAKQIAVKLNNLINPFVLEEFERLRSKLEEYQS
jgi:hypothetical protein